MGLFNRKKKSPSLSLKGKLPSPCPSFSTVVPTPPGSPCFQCPPPVFKPQTTLQVALDPAPLDDGNALFTVMLDQDSDIAALRSAIATRIGNASISLFKVAIPTLAHRQATEYRNQYSASVNLLTRFPAFNLDDPRQLRCSLGMGWSGSVINTTDKLQLKDWFPETAQTDVISVLVRTSESSSSSSDIPITFVTHFAPNEPAFSSRMGHGPKSSPAPTVVTVDRTQSIASLKRAILRADSRDVKEELIERVVLWRVEMSEEEMIVIGERGGLKNGRMPWPYPPGSLVPIALTDDALPINHYFPETTSMPQMVSISVWLDAQACAEMPRNVLTGIPSFQFPMVHPEPPKVDATPSPRRSRQRPSTAPAVVHNTGEAITSVHTFGSRSFPVRAATTPQPNLPSSRPRMASPLSTTSMPATAPRGLGIDVNVPVPPAMSTTNSTTSSSSSSSSSSASSCAPTTPVPSITRSNTMPRGSISASDCSSMDEDIPSLSFSRLSLGQGSTDGDASGPLTPEAADKAGFDWLVANTPMPGASSMKSFHSLGAKMGERQRAKFAF